MVVLDFLNEIDSGASLPKDLDIAIQSNFVVCHLLFSFVSEQKTSK